jgi:hypothetical protein
MQIQFIPVRKTNSGFALAITLCFLAVSLLTFAYIMYLTSSSATVTSRNNLYNMSQAAAEGAVEMAVAQMNRDFLYQSLNPGTVYWMAVTNLVQTNWPVQFKITDTNGVQNQISVNIFPQTWQQQATNVAQLNSSRFPNMYGYVAECTVTANATPLNQSYDMTATVSQKLQMAGIPVFQFGVFYNLDMDLSNGKPMTMNGKTFVNGIIWMYPQNTMTFNDLVEATLVVTNHDNPNDQQNLTTYTAPTYNFTANGGKALDKATAVSMPLNGVNSNPTNVEAILNLPPAGVGAPLDAAYESSNQMYLYNKCDLIVSNATTGTNAIFGTNFVIYYQDKSGANTFTKLTNETFTFSNKVSPYSVYTTNSPYPGAGTNWVKIAAGFPWVTNVAFYDFRESDNVKAVQVDVARLGVWLYDPASQGYRWNQQCGGSDGANGTKGHPIDSVYVYNNITSLAGSPGTLPAVRVVNGAQLPSSKGLTIATPFPLYVKGDYNIQQAAAGPYSKLTTDTSHTYPAALMGDAITILSSSWSDTYNSSTALSSRNVPAGGDTVNAAALEGIVPSTYAGKKQYSGGLENFLRLEENWNGATLCYNGSIVVMFPSIYATNYWVGPSQLTGYPAPYYSVPTRQWGFDANFKTQFGQPPASPQIKAMIRGQWSTPSQ